MKEIPLTQGKTATIDDDDFVRVSVHKWSFDPKGYAFTNIGKRPHRRILYMHRLILQAPKGKECDHINNNKLDNRRENLRLCTREENSRNRKLFKNATGYKGVYFDKDSEVYYAQVKFRGQTICGGRSKDVKVSAAYYNKVAVELHGEFANLNPL